VAHGAAGGDGGGRTQLLPTMEVSAMTVLTVSSPVFSSLLLFFSFFSLGSLLSVPILLLSSFSLSLSFFLALPSPIFIGKKQGRERTGRPLCCRHSNTWKALGCVGVFLKGKMAVIEEEKIFFFPCFARPGEEEDPQCRLKQHYLGPFFLMNNV